ncbi:MAG: hypothetical protein HRT37_21610 [Alteromonadaceae bacterium]|nr:hypothetical protein [Alteromonadaceae bacterium]
MNNTIMNLGHSSCSATDNCPSPEFDNPKGDVILAIVLKLMLSYQDAVTLRQ